MDKKSQGRVQHRSLTIVLYGAACFMFWAAMYTYVPTLSTYAESMSPNLSLVGVVVAQYGLWQAVARLPLGVVSDWIGRRKPFIIGGFLLAGLGALVMGSSEGVLGLAVGRGITGLAAATWVLIVVAFSSLFPAEDAVRASAIMSLVGASGRVLATFSNGFLNEWGGYPLAYFVGAALAAVATLIVVPIQEARRERKPPTLRGVGKLITRRDVLVPALLAAVSQYAVWGTTLGLTPVLATRLGAADRHLGMLVSMNMLVGVGGNLLTATIIRWIGARRLIVVGFVVFAIGLVAVALAPSLGVLFAAQFVMGLAQGVSYPVLMGMSIRYVEEGQRSTAMGLHQAVYGVGMFVGPAVTGLLGDLIGLPVTFILTAVVTSLVGMLGTWWLDGGEG